MFNSYSTDLTYAALGVKAFFGRSRRGNIKVVRLDTRIKKNI